MYKDSSILDDLMLSLKDKGATSIYHILPKAYIVLDLRGRILGYNPKCKDLLGLIHHEGETKNMNEFLIGENKERFMIMLELVELMGNVNDFELEITAPCGRKKVIWISSSAIYDSKKNAIAIHCLMSDMTREQMFLDQMKEELRTFSDQH